MSSSGSSSVRSVPSVRSERRGLTSLSRSMFSGVPSPTDAKSLRDLEVIKACHDITSVVTGGSLGLIQERYNIPEEYVLRALLPEQRPYHPKSTELSILVDALEAGLRFPLHPTIVDCLRWWRISPSQVAPNSWHYLIAFLGECRGAGIILTRTLFFACFRLCKVEEVLLKRPNKTSISREAVTERPSKRVKITVRKHKSRRDEGSSHATAQGKEPAVSTEEDSSPTHCRSRSMKDLCDTRVYKGDEGYYVLQIANSTPKDPDSVM
ncbi:hypothetical protein BHM03_00057343 [Ensete ventricosum]|nr:hypothetical protein BHM03_00057343 [Ensete ventricosum]